MQLPSTAVSRRGALTVMAGGMLAGIGSPHVPRRGLDTVRIATGGPGGVYSRLGAALTRILKEDYPRLRPEFLITTASAANLRLIRAGAAEVAFTQADILIDRDPPPLQGLARLYDDCLHLVVRAGEARGVTDLRGHRVSPGSPGSGTEVTATRLLSAAGMRLGQDLVSVRMGVDESARALIAGDISGFFFSGGLPVDAIAVLAATMPIRLLDLGRYLPKLRAEYGEVYAERTVPRSAYRVDSISTVGVPNYLVAGAELPEETAYALTRTLLGRRDLLSVAHPAAERVNHMAAIATHPLPLHPGAARYFRESKY